MRKIRNIDLYYWQKRLNEQGKRQERKIVRRWVVGIAALVFVGYLTVLLLMSM